MTTQYPARQALCLAMLLLIAVAAHATPILLTDTCINDAASLCVTGFEGIEFEDVTYDVDLELTSFDEFVDAGPPRFWGDEAGADAMTSLLLGLLDGAGISGPLGNGEAAFDAIVLVHGANPSLYNASCALNSGVDWFLGDCNASPEDVVDPPGFYWTHARFTARGTVAEPPTLALLAFGLWGAWHQRHRAPLSTRQR